MAAKPVFWSRAPSQSKFRSLEPVREYTDRLPQTTSQYRVPDVLRMFHGRIETELVKRGMTVKTLAAVQAASWTRIAAIDPGHPDGLHDASGD